MLFSSIETIHTNTHTQTNTHTNTHTYTHIHTRTHAHTHPHTPTRTTTCYIPIVLRIRLNVAYISLFLYNFPLFSLCLPVKYSRFGNRDYFHSSSLHRMLSLSRAP